MNMKKIACEVSLGIILIMSATGCGSHHESYKESAYIETKSASDIQEMLLADEDFWLFTGDTNQQNCIDFQWKLDDYLKKENKTILYMDTDLLGEELEAKEAIWKQLGFEEDEIVEAILHLSNGYRIARYDINEKNEVKEFYNAYAADITSSNQHIQRISVDDFFEKKDAGDDFWVYLGRPSCYNCRVMYRKVIRFIDEENKDLYYILSDAEYLSDQEIEHLKAFNDANDENSIPVIIHMKDGNPVRYYNISYEEDFTAFKEDMIK